VQAKFAEDDKIDSDKDGVPDVRPQRGMFWQRFLDTRQGTAFLLLQF